MSSIKLVLIGEGSIKGLHDRPNTDSVSWDEWVHASITMKAQRTRLKLKHWITLNQDIVVWPLSYRTINLHFQKKHWSEYQKSAWQALMLLMMQQYPFINALSHHHLSTTFWHSKRLVKLLRYQNLEWQPEKSVRVYVQCLGKMVWACETDGTTQVIVPLKVVRSCQKLMRQYGLDVAHWGFYVENDNWIAVSFAPELITNMGVFPQGLALALDQLMRKKSQRKMVYISEEERPDLEPRI